MTYASRHAAIVACAWFIILVGVILLVVIPGPTRFADPDYKVLRLVTAVIILPGFVLNGWIGYRSRIGRKNGLIDERDDAIARRAAEVTLFVLTVTVYAVSLLLYETSVGTGAVSRGWLYLIAYGTVALLPLVHAVSSLILNRRGWSDA